MSPKFARIISRLKKPFFVITLFACFSNGAAAATISSSSYVGSGSLDEWLAIGLAALAGLYCVQKRV